MADIIDISSLVSSSVIQTIDFRDFISLQCGVKVEFNCFSESNDHLFDSLKQCGSRLSGVGGDVDKCVYAVEEDCRTTVWTYQRNDDGVLDSFQPDELLKKKKKISYVRKSRDVYNVLGPGSKAESADVLAFGSLFTSPYKGSELYIDIHEAPGDQRIGSLIQNIEFLPFVSSITSAGKEYAFETIKGPFLCAQLRLLDGQFKNHWKATFSALKKQVDSLKNGPLPISIFVMTDLPEADWAGSYLEDLARDSDSIKLHVLKEKDELVIRTAKKVMETGHVMRLGLVPDSVDRTSRVKQQCPPQLLPNILLYIEETVCSCASLGFVGTSGSTIAESIEMMRKFNICPSHT